MEEAEEHKGARRVLLVTRKCARHAHSAIDDNHTSDLRNGNFGNGGQVTKITQHSVKDIETLEEKKPGRVCCEPIDNVFHCFESTL